MKMEILVFIGYELKIKINFPMKYFLSKINLLQKENTIEIKRKKQADTIFLLLKYQ